MENELAKQLLDDADRLYDKGDMRAALEAYRDVLADDPDSSWAYNRIGAILAQTGADDEAESALRKALELDPKLSQAHSNLGNVYFARGEYDKALEKYKAAIALNPDNPIFHQNLHAVYKKMGRISEAVAALKQSHRLNRTTARDEAKQAYAKLKRRAGCMGSTLVVLLLLVGLLTLAFR